jgi:hypothetical protein
MLLWFALVKELLYHRNNCFVFGGWGVGYRFKLRALCLIGTWPNIWTCPQPFLLLLIFHIGSNFLPRITSDHYLPITASQAGIPGVSHHPQLICHFLMWYRLHYVSSPSLSKFMTGSWRCGSSGKGPALQVWNPELKPQSHTHKKVQINDWATRECSQYWERRTGSSCKCIYLPLIRGSKFIFW